MSSPLPLIDAGRPTEIIEPFADRLQREGGPLVRHSLTDLQINLGKLCNQTCTHCHVEAGPTKKRENMDAKTAERVLELSNRSAGLKTVDLTGGAPELNPNFRLLVKSFRARGLRVIDRCNLTILLHEGFESLGEFLASNRVDVVASLPCYLEDNVDLQRGSGVFAASIDALRSLNALGYGQAGSGLHLDLVYNPTGPSLPPDQAALEAEYKRELHGRYQVEFNRLLVITNIPIKRYAMFLRKQGKLDQYLQLLCDNFNPAAASHVMCRSMISVGWDGSIYDCDFNQMLELPTGLGSRSIWSIESFDDLIHQHISVADHCYGCTAGAGSGCGGAIVPKPVS